MSDTDNRSERDIEVAAIELEVLEVYKETYKDNKFECFLTNLKEKFNVTLDRYYLIGGLTLQQLADHIYMLQQLEKVPKPDTPFKINESIFMATVWWYREFPIDEIKWQYKKDNSAVSGWTYRSGACFLPDIDSARGDYFKTPWGALWKMVKNQCRELLEKAKNS